MVQAKVLECEVPILIVKPLVRCQTNRVISLTKNAKSVIGIKQGTTNIRITLERDGFNLINSFFNLSCEVDNNNCEQEIKKVKFKLIKTLELRERPPRSISQ
jgi:hypothetical protein